MITSSTALSLVLSFFTISLVRAGPVGKLDVYVPPIVTPVKNEIWKIGQNRTVTWNTTSPIPPTHITNPVGTIMLRKGARTLLDVILADKFDILCGAMNVTVPDVVPGNDYRVVLFGDSGNWSPVFTIKVQL